jgi:peptide/nickel transport system substrate-binding protein
MKKALILTGLFLVLSVAVFGQGYDAMPADARILPMGVAGTAYEDAELGVRGGTFNTWSLEDPRTWNNHAAQETSTSWFTNRMLRGLTNLDHMTGAIVVDLAKSYELSEDSLVITFHLRQGINWSDGVPITADDILFTFNDLIMNEDVATNARDGLILPDGTFPVVEKVDDYTVTFTMSTIYRPVLNALSSNIMPKHVLAEYVHKLNPSVPVGTFNETWSLDTPLDELVGCGPWMVSDYQVNVAVTMERNPYYWAYDSAGTQLPYYDKIVVHVVTNEDVAMLKFRNGELDAYGCRPEDLPILLAEKDSKGFDVMVTDEMNYGTRWILVNQDIGLAEGTDAEKRELYQNVEFREALAHLLDKETMVQNVLNGLGVPQWSPVSVPSPFFAGRDYYGGPVTNTDAVWYEYSHEIAASKLDALGVVDQDGDGWRDLPSGAPLAIELNTNDNTLRIAYCLIIQDDFRAAGLNCNFQVVDFNTLVGDLLNGTGDIIMLGLTGGDEPNNGKNVQTTCGNLNVFRLSSCENPNELELRINELYDLGANTFDIDEAFGYYKEAQQLIAHQLGYIYLCHLTFLYSYYDYLGNGALSSTTSTPGGWNGLLTEMLFDRRLQ